MNKQKLSPEEVQKFKNEKVELARKHLLYWIFVSGRCELTQDDFISAPEWAWKAYEQKRKEFEKVK